MKSFFIGRYQIRNVGNDDLVSCLSYLEPKLEYTLDVETMPRYGWEHYPLAGLDPHTTNVVMLQLSDGKMS